MEFANHVFLVLYGVVLCGKCCGLYLCFKFPQWTKASEMMMMKVLWAYTKVPFTSLELPIRHYFVLLVTTIPSYCETLATSIAIGVAQRVCNSAMSLRCTNAWAFTPLGLFAFVCWFFLPSILAGILVVGICLHVFTFIGGVCVFLYTKRKRTHAVKEHVNDLATIASATGMLLLLPILQALDEQYDGNRGGKGMEIIVRVAVKLVFGTSLRAWVKVSLASVLWASGAEWAVVQPALVAASFSFIHAAQINAKTADFRLTYRATEEGHDRGADIRVIVCRCPVCISLGLLIFLLPLWGSLIRFAGLFVCESHMRIYQFFHAYLRSQTHQMSHNFSPFDFQLSQY